MTDAMHGPAFDDEADTNRIPAVRSADAVRSDPPHPSSARRPSLRWYFAPGLWLPLKLIVFAWFVWAVLSSVFYGALHLLGIVRLLFALLGAVHWFVPILLVPVTLPTSLALSFAPAYLYFMQFAILPGAWTSDEPFKTKVGGTLATVVGFTLLAVFLNWLVVTGIGWAADLNPCASFRAGVTGSVPPPSSCR